MSQPGPAEQVRVRVVTPEFFDELGAHALHGRVLSAKDTDAVVLSFGFWKRRFLSDPGAVGRTIVLHGYPFNIAGVMPREFNGVSADNTPDIRATLNALAQLMMMPAYHFPLWSLSIFAIDILAVYGLVAYGKRVAD